MPEKSFLPKKRISRHLQAKTQGDPDDIPVTATEQREKNKTG